VQGTEGYPGYSFLVDLFNFSYRPEQLLKDEILKNQVSRPTPNVYRQAKGDVILMSLTNEKTSSGGPNWVEYLTGCYEGFPWACKKQLWDFAFAGSDISVEL